VSFIVQRRLNILFTTKKENAVTIELHVKTLATTIFYSKLVLASGGLLHPP